MVRNSSSGSNNVSSTNNNLDPLDPNNGLSEYFIHPNENPAVSLVTKPLIGPSNYYVWA